MSELDDLHAAVKAAEAALITPQAELRARRNALAQKTMELSAMAKARGWRTQVQGTSIVAVRDDDSELSTEDRALYDEWLHALRLDFQRMRDEEDSRGMR